MPELKYHHIGIPTDKELPDEDYKPENKLSNIVVLEFA